MSLKRQAVATNFEGVCREIRVIGRDEEGVAAIEYALLAALIVVVAAASVVLLGDGVGGMWTWISDEVRAAV